MKETKATEATVDEESRERIFIIFSEDFPAERADLFCVHELWLNPDP